MGQHILPGEPPVEITVRKSTRARRISLRVSGLDGRVTLTVPRGTSEREALRFANDKGDWLRGHVQAQPEMVQVGIGDCLPVAGMMRRIVVGSGRRVLLGDDTLAVPGMPDRAAARLAGYLKTSARDRLAEASDDYAARLGLPYGALSLRDTRSRWGSCTAKGGLMYSWRLIMAPPEVLRYVAAHEVAHLAEMNHSPDFWAVVQRLYGDYGAPRRWLRQEGGALHRYRF